VGVADVLDVVAMTARPLFSSSWYRVAALRPQLRAHAEIHRQRFRGETWYVLEDRVREQFHRFSPAVYQVIGLMDGRRTVQALWDLACERLGDEAPTQDDMIVLMSQLHAADVLQSERAPDTDELAERGERQRRRRLAGQLLSVLSWRIPLLDPERLLERTMPLARPLAGWPGALLWLAVVGPAMVLAAVHWRELTHGAIDQIMSAQSLLAFWVLFMTLKALHELGHAVLTRAYGGEVHDMGLMLLVFHPVPYVDASAAWKFPDRWRRIAVGAAGMLVELFLAAVAMYVWLGAEPGLVRTLAFDTIVIAGASTVLFNANPLLRFDGYYMLSDWVEIPNLRTRANRYLGYLCERYLFGGTPERPRTARGEPAWFVGYAVASFLYRIVVVAVILVLLGQSHVQLALIVAGLVAVAWVGMPLARGGAYLLTSPRLRPVRVRAVLVTTAALGALVALLGWAPLPHRSRAEGVIWVPEDALVRPAVNGFVDAIAARPGERVRRGQPLFTLHDPTLVAHAAELEARRRELRAERDRHLPADRVKAAMAADELRYVEGELAEARQRVTELTVTAGRDGTFVVPVPEDLPGRFVKRGELVGYVMELGTVTVRAVVPQADIDLVREHTRTIHVRLAERLGDSVPAEIRRVVPAATDRLPAAALGAEGGGRHPVDPRDARSVKALARVFEVDVELRQRAHHVNVGGRAFVRFDHGRAPLARQWYRDLRQLFLGRFDA
jgi:putative peptide zinc metalloprotease protein